MADFPGDDDWGEVDGEEEPLFADDIEDEDLPPLPPPMPSLAELSQTASGSAAATLRVNPNSEENFRGALCHVLKSVPSPPSPPRNCTHTHPLFMVL